MLDKKFNRRTIFQALALGLGSLALPRFALAAKTSFYSASDFGDFNELTKINTDNLEIADGFKYKTLIRWGDGLFSGVEEIENLALKQEKCFGYNNDFCAYFPVTSSRHGILAINHEYPISELMYSDSKNDEFARYEMAAVGVSIVEVEKKNDEWNFKKDGEYNRRITAYSEVEFSGYAASDERLKSESEGRVGTLANCAGGKTPWGSYLTCEENFDDYFAGAKEEEIDGIKFAKDSSFGWEKYDERFNREKHPNEINKYGWVVEIDPYDNTRKPIKRTSLGRFKHECATTALSADGRLIVYMGDDEEFQHIYKFVSTAKFEKGGDNNKILDEGVLYAAKFLEDGTIKWLELSIGKNNITEENGFKSQADICIKTRIAAKLAGATEMDRPEDVQANEQTGEIFVCLTKNESREKTNVANPTTPNKFGHIIKMTPPKTETGFDHASEDGEWEFFVFGSENFANPDNIAFDISNNLWLTSDGMEDSLGKSDGFFLIKNRTPVRFLSAPFGAELCGPEFTPDGKSLFVCVQHPGEGSQVNDPSTRWPDFNDKLPPRPAVIVASKI